MESVFSFLIIAIFMLMVVKKRKNRENMEIDSHKRNIEVARNIQPSVVASPKSKGAQTVKAVSRNTAKRNTTYDMPKKVQGGLKNDSKLSASLRDDRVGDWLAGQMREERASLFKLREMFGFRMEGRNLTDAELLKEFHSDHCDAGGVDTASGN